MKQPLSYIYKGDGKIREEFMVYVRKLNKQYLQEVNFRL